MKIDIKEIRAVETHTVRHSILRPNQSIGACDYPGDHDEKTFHLGAFDNGKLIGIASFYEEALKVFTGSPQYRLRGMATLPEYRGKHIGQKLIKFAEDILMDRGAALWWCNARMSAIGFYEKLGLAIYGDEFQIEGIGPHKVMVQHLQ